jgi:hypothetical protein
MQAAIGFLHRGFHQCQYFPSSQRDVAVKKWADGRAETIRKSSLVASGSDFLSELRHRPSAPRRMALGPSIRLGSTMAHRGDARERRIS